MEMKYSVGDVVTIRSKEDVVETINPLNKKDGCLFMEQMWNYCGKNFRILKIVKNYFDEYRFKMFKVEPPLYILKDLICDGLVESLEHGCDRSCYFLWHEDWLEKSQD